MRAKMVIICREVKSGGEVKFYPLDMEMTRDTLAELSIRVRMDPELRFYVTQAEAWENPALRENIMQMLQWCWEQEVNEDA